MARSFRTPKDNAPTRHLFIANCGVSAGLSEGNVEELFTALKAVSIQEEKRSVVFATFKDATAACEAAAQLRSEQIESQYQKKFVVKYAELNEVSAHQHKPARHCIACPHESLWPSLQSACRCHRSRVRLCTLRHKTVEYRG